MINPFISLFTVALCVAAVPVQAQISQSNQSTHIKGNTEINVTTEGATAIASGQNNVAKNRIGVVKGEKQGNTKITVNTGTVTTIVSGHNKKACTNIGGIVSDECK
jgi:hypothetical protein